MTITIKRKQMSNEETEQNNPFTIEPKPFNNSLQISNIFDNDFMVQPVQPVNTDIFYPIIGSLKTLSDDNVQKNTCEIIYSLGRIIDFFRVRESFTNYLAKLHLTEQEDKTALLEWNFKNFRFGFTIEPNQAETSYYYVSIDHYLGRYSMDSKKFGSAAIDEIIRNIVKRILAIT